MRCARKDPLKINERSRCPYPEQTEVRVCLQEKRASRVCNAITRRVEQESSGLSRLSLLSLYFACNMNSALHSADKEQKIRGRSRSARMKMEDEEKKCSWHKNSRTKGRVSQSLEEITRQREREIMSLLFFPSSDFPFSGEREHSLD